MHARLLLVAALLTAGCVAAPAPQGTDTAGAAALGGILPGFPQEHDHGDPTLHDFSQGISALSYHNLVPDTDGSDASARGEWLNSEIIIRGSYAYVAYLGAPWLFSIVDIADPAAPKLVGAYETANAWGMDIAVSDDGDWVFVSVYPHAIGTVFDQNYVLDHLAAPNGVALPGVAVVDARDRTSPKLTGFLPIHGFGPHTAVYHRYPDGREVIFANKADSPPGNGILVAEVVPLPTGGKTLEPLTLFTLDGVLDTFPHDVDVQQHPLTNETLLYAAWWTEGLVILNVDDPTHPKLVSRHNDVPEGETNLHDVHPAPMLVNGRHYTVSGPEMPTGDVSGHVRVWDTTDPANPTHVSSWIMPGDYLVNTPFGYSTHNFQYLPDGRIALAHGHAGVWILDWTSDVTAPQAVAFHVPHADGAKRVPWAPVDGVPWVWGTAIDGAGNVWAADSASGLWALKVDVPPAPPSSG